MLFYVVYRNNHLYAAYILYGKLMRENIMSSSVAALADLLFAANAIPTWKNSRSTAAEDAGQPRYCRAITATLGNSLACSCHHSVASRSVFILICGSAR